MNELRNVKTSNNDNQYYDRNYNEQWQRLRDLLITNPEKFPVEVVTMIQLKLMEEVLNRLMNRMVAQLARLVDKLD